MFHVYDYHIPVSGYKILDEAEREITVDDKIASKVKVMSRHLTVSSPKTPPPPDLNLSLSV